ncbi:diacylglycerol/lipid kinase family protein [Desertivirga arenae]|uniref:diacylglycerol/lipid kinase family protein n=1 Tax=Desertivirga arenae TaxID=2810309 RepID=UPI001A973BBD|nr:diacylglycerol kinase family protein [Pedobacter sp. SYSU D00823]
MPKATLLHNPKAGEEAFTPNELVSKIEAQNIDCVYRSVRDDWTKIDEQTDFLIVAGGDGTVRKVTETLLELDLHQTYPIALLPSGTANNIARTLSLSDDEDLVISHWQNPKIKKYDVGRIHNLKGSSFFLESFGYGVFPVLMTEMGKQEEGLKDTPEKKLKLAVEILHQIIESYEPAYCELEVDGIDHSGKFLLVEIMNTQSIGPNLVLSPHANPGDGEFEVVLIPESQKEKLLNYVGNKLQGIEAPNLFDICKAKNIKIKCHDLLAHVDDETVEIHQQAEVRIELIEGMLEFMV